MYAMRSLWRAVPVAVLLATVAACSGGAAGSATTDPSADRVTGSASTAAQTADSIASSDDPNRKDASPGGATGLTPEEIADAIGATGLFVRSTPDGTGADDNGEMDQAEAEEMRAIVEEGRAAFREMFGLTFTHAAGAKLDGQDVEIVVADERPDDWARLLCRLPGVMRAASPASTQIGVGLLGPDFAVVASVDDADPGFAMMEAAAARAARQGVRGEARVINCAEFEQATGG